VYHATIELDGGPFEVATSERLVIPVKKLIDSMK
jgi:hypothetical protein